MHCNAGATHHAIEDTPAKTVTVTIEVPKTTTTTTVDIPKTTADSKAATQQTAAATQQPAQTDEAKKQAELVALLSTRVCGSPAIDGYVC